MTGPLCWCCAVWGIKTPAIVADERLCSACLRRKRADCENVHYLEALGLTAADQPVLFSAEVT